MGKIFERIEEDLKNWLELQKMFFVATSPLAREGLINCSPKGQDTFRVLGPKLVAYQDLTGSGIETVSHLRENGRIVIMFFAFQGSPKIVRLHGTGEVLESGHPDFDDIGSHFPLRTGTRSYIRIAVSRISDSCGYSLPLFEYKEDRDVLDKWTEGKGREGIVAYQREENMRSIDNLPGLSSPAD